MQATVHRVLYLVSLQCLSSRSSNILLQACGEQWFCIIIAYNSTNRTVPPTNAER
ncbi:hypothetical protein PAXRUDRAFT_828148 [Paxillus rubicundulus Ve08.2h10]|uniref:Unplaced genomic scaffold scaffold_296, whole genome shotgun sequence n=1 Tax=Paxillus rubicundulus Ve08.2h10 TaxID=930991 RepID=A0A0D0DWJ4_9AGAM|nr:hypothetical protein PAXRUDRAFT_828148 [Paxillus rubicundulus Ve08.2h10]